MDEADHDLVAFWIVVRWRRDGNTVGRVAAQAQAEAIGLHARGGLARRARFARLNQGQQAALGLPGDDIRIERKIAIPHALTARDAARVAGRKMPNARAILGIVVDAVVGLAVLRVAFAQQRVADPGLGHQVAFIGGVDEHLGAKDGAVFADEVRDAWSGFVHFGEPGLSMHLHTRFARQVVEELLRLVRLDGISATGGRTAALRPERFVPGQFRARGGREPGEILARDAANTARVADVHRAQPTGRHAAQVARRLGEDHGLAHAGRLHRGDDAAGGAAIDADVGLDGCWNVRRTDYGRRSR